MHRNFTFLYATAFFINFNSCKCKEQFSIDNPGNWARYSDLTGVPRSEAACFVTDSYAYICTGYSNRSDIRLKDCWQFDPNDSAWTQRADFPGTARNSAVAFSINNKGYVGTGYDGNHTLNDFWEYDPSSNTWTQKAGFRGAARYDAVGFSIQHTGYIGTGNDGVHALKDFWQYDPSGNTWIQKPDLTGKQRSAAVSFVYNDKAYIVTGLNNDTAVNDFWLFDPSLLYSEVWHQLRSIANVTGNNYDDGYTNIVRWNAAAFVISGTVSGDKAYISTGENGFLNRNTWEYDFATDTWKEKSPFENVPRTGALGLTIQNKGFVMTGRNSTKDFSEVFKFDPDQVTNSND